MTNFIDIKDLTNYELREILNVAEKFKKRRFKDILRNKTGLMIFEKPSLRTRVSFEVCINDLGGKSSILNSNEFKFGERESVYDTAKVLERYVDFVIIRSYDHSILKKFCNFFSKPVINALTDHSHPCQVVADVLTLKEKAGELEGKKIAWFGDCNNVTQSWIEASVILNLNFFIATPKNLRPANETLEWIKKNDGNVVFSENIEKVAEQADCIITDTWVSMGDDQGKSIEQFRPYQINSRLMNLAKPNAVFMHCLPAHRGFEVTKDVIDSSNSAIYDQAENRMSSQKAIIDFCFAKKN